MITHEQGNSAYGAGKASGEVWKGKPTKARISKEFHSWLDYRRPTFPWIAELSESDLKQLEMNFSAGVKYGWDNQEVGPYPKHYPNPSPGWFDRCMEGVSRSGSAYDPGAVCGALEKKMGYRRNPAIKPRGFKEESSGTLWYKEYKSLNAAERKLQELLHEGYRAAINFLNGKHRVRVGMDDGPGADWSENRRRRTNPKGGRLTPGEASHILGLIGADRSTDFHTLSGSQVDRLLDEADKVKYRKSKSASGSRALMFFYYVQRTASSRRNAGPYSIRKTKKRVLKTFGRRISSATVRKAYGVRKNNPGRYTVLISGTAWVQGHELIISAKSSSAARAEAKSWYRRQFPGKRVPGMSVVRTAWIDTAPNKRKNSSTAETLLYNKFRRQGYSAAEAERMAKLNAPYYSRGKKRNRLVHTPTASRRTRKAVEHRISSALRRYAARKPNRTRRRRY